MSSLIDRLKQYFVNMKVMDGIESSKVTPITQNDIYSYSKRTEMKAEANSVEKCKLTFSYNENQSVVRATSCKIYRKFFLS
jgi:hypothetical protein